MVVLLMSLIFLLVALLSWVYLLYDSKRMKIPGPCPIPILGNALSFLGDTAHLLKTMDNIRNKFGDIIQVHLLNARYVMLAHPKYIELVCSSTEYTYKAGSYRYLKPWLGEGLLTASGPRWKKHRKLLTPAFHFNILQTFLPVFCKNEKILVKKLHRLANGQPFDLFSIIALAALDNVTETIMGVSVNAQEDVDSDYVKAVEEISKLLAARMRYPWLWSDFIFNLIYKDKQDKNLAVLHGQTDKVIAVRREELNQNGITTLAPVSESGIKNKQAFLDLLLLSEVDGQKIDDIAVREEVNTFMFEGHDTTTSGIVFCLHCISQHPNVQDKLFKEQQDIFGDDLSRDVTFSELNQMQYLEQVIKESLRLYPSVPLIERYTTQDSTIAGYFIPKDTSIIINILHMQRNPEVHEDPLAFRPERVEHCGNKPFNWMFFSAGPRNCIGQKFAMMEMKVTLAGIIKNFKLIPSDKQIDLCGDLILRSKTGVHVGFITRNSLL